MLAQAQDKGKATHSSVEFRLQDMRTLVSPQHPWDAVICLFDSIGYVATNENILKVINGVRCQLNSGGLFIFEFWHAAAMLKSYDPLRVRRWQTPNGEIVRISETSIDHATQLCSVTYTIYELFDDGHFRMHKEKQVNRFFLVQEMTHFLEVAQFFPLKWFAGFTPNEKIDETTWHIICVARAL